MTTQEQIDELQAAKTKVLTQGQSYTADGLQMTRADLPAIDASLKELKRQLVQESRAGFAGGGLGYGVPTS